MKKLRLAVIGVGVVGRYHAQILSNMKEVELKAICDSDREKIKELASLLEVESFLNYRRLLGKVDAVSIAVPTAKHFPIAYEFLSSNTHVLVEKPFTLTLQEADTLIKLAEKKRLTLQVGHIERFNSAYQAVQNIIGRPRFIECHRLSPFPKRSLDIGVVLDLMIHDIDIILGLVKSRIKSVQAVGIRVLTSQEDIAHARIVFEDGCICNLTASRISEEKMRKIRIFQKNSYISLDYVLQEASIYKKVGKKIIRQLIPTQKQNPLRKELECFINMIKKKKVSSSAQEAREALKVALQIQRKIWRRRSS